MDISGEYLIPAPREAVWAALNDADVLRVCIPGCEELTRVSDTEFAAKVRSKIGAVSARFSGTVTLIDLDPPSRYTIAGQGQGGAAGFAKGEARVELEPRGDETLLRYRAEASVGGKLAAVGSRVIQGVAKKTADDFFNAFAARFGGAATPPAAADELTAQARPTQPRPKRRPLPVWAWAAGAGAVALLLLVLWTLSG